MGLHKQNVPTRFDADTLLRIDEERTAHKMTRSQYVRESMIKWLRMVAEGTVQLLDVPLQAEHWKNCAQREHGEQCEQIEFPAAAPMQGRAKKPPVRVPSRGASRGLEVGNISRRVVLAASVAYSTSAIHFTRVNEAAA